MTRVLALLLLLLAVPADAAITFVNAAVGEDLDGSSEDTVTTETFAVASGNHIVVGIRSFAGTISTVTDLAGNTYTHLPACSPIIASGDTLWIYYTPSAIAHASNTITVTWTAGTTFRSVVALQHAGAGAYDTCENGTGTTPTCTSGSFTTTTAAQVIVSFAQQASGTQTWSSGSGTIRDADSVHTQAGQSQIVSTIQTGVTASMTSTGTGDVCSILVATFRERRAGKRLLLGVP